MGKTKTFKASQARKNRFAVILAGGQGSRFWPQSRTLEPKQFLSLAACSATRRGPETAQSFFEDSIERIETLMPPQNIYISTSELYRDQVFNLVSRYGVPFDNVILEPSSKNTAPSIAVALRLISKINPCAKVAVFPCDHAIQNKNRFLSQLRKAFAACDNHLVILGITPHRPATGYGYIKIKRSRLKSADRPFPVVGFFEKPDISRAREFLKSGAYFWNSGIFIGSCAVFLEEFKKLLPGIAAHLLSIEDRSDIASVWKKFPSISFDCGVLEKTSRLLMIPSDDLGWSDLGSWQAWDELVPKENDGNLFRGDIVHLECKDTTILGSARLIAAIGLEDLIVVDTPDALLVTKKNKSEYVKKVVDILAQNRRQEHQHHKTVKRHWGNYTVLEKGVHFKVKLVEVLPHKSLSLQYHRRRSEHWIVIEGEAEVVRGNEKLHIPTNESTFIPVGCVHRLSNLAPTTLKVIEIQSGDYLEEDDIVRLKEFRHQEKR